MAVLWQRNDQAPQKGFKIRTLNVDTESICTAKREWEWRVTSIGLVDQIYEVDDGDLIAQPVWDRNNQSAGNAGVFFEAHKLGKPCESVSSSSSSSRACPTVCDSLGCDEAFVPPEFTDDVFNLTSLGRIVRVDSCPDGERLTFSRDQQSPGKAGAIFDVQGIITIDEETCEEDYSRLRLHIDSLGAFVMVESLEPELPTGCLNSSNCCTGEDKLPTELLGTATVFDKCPAAADICFLMVLDEFGCAYQGTFTVECQHINPDDEPEEIIHEVTLYCKDFGLAICGWGLCINGLSYESSAQSGGCCPVEICFESLGNGDPDDPNGNIGLQNCIDSASAGPDCKAPALSTRICFTAVPEGFDPETECQALPCLCESSSS